MPQWVDGVRYWIAVIVVSAMPPAVLYWFLLHPFAAFWRRVGQGLSLAILLASMVVEVAALFSVRDRIVGADLGTYPVLLVLGIMLYATAGVVERWIRRTLTTRILIGVPELSDENPGSLLTEGAFAHCRNPRYVNGLVATLGFACIANYVGAWIMTAATGVALWLIVLLEERELRARFGEEYRAYCRRVPRFLPRMRRAE